MPKMKTHKGLKKRLKINSKNLCKHKQVNKRHILTKKTSKRKRQLRKSKFIKINNNIKYLL